MAHVDILRHLWRKWGRVGTPVGGNKDEEYHSREGAKFAFFKLYLYLNKLLASRGYSQNSDSRIHTFA